MFLKYNPMQNKAFIIADLGGGTLDFSAYVLTNMQPFEAREVSASRCKVQAFYTAGRSFTKRSHSKGELEGATLVTTRAKTHLKGTIIIF